MLGEHFRSSNGCCLGHHILSFCLFFSISHFFFFKPMDLIIAIVFMLIPVVTKNISISPRFTPYVFLSRCKFGTLTTRESIMVEF